MHELVEIYALRISRAQDARCLKALQDFWAASFGSVRGLKYSEDVAMFLRDLLVALPGWLVADGLEMEGLSSLVSCVLLE
jgi:hypothetical protein